LDLQRLSRALQVPPRTQSGAGLGIWLSAHVAYAMDGSLRGARVESGGSRFRLELPLAGASSDGPGPSTVDGPRSAG
jgi:K+-sensing histidine kinase KdpD